MSSKEGLGCWWLQPSLFSSVYVKTSPERSENFGHVTVQPCGPPKRRKRDPFLPRCTTNPRPRRQRATFPTASLQRFSRRLSADVAAVAEPPLGVLGRDGLERPPDRLEQGLLRAGLPPPQQRLLELAERLLDGREV